MCNCCRDTVSRQQLHTSRWKVFTGGCLNEEWSKRPLMFEKKSVFQLCSHSTAVHSWSWHCNVTLLKPRLLFFVLRSRASTCTLASPAPLCACGKFIVYNCCKSIAASFRRWILLKCSMISFQFSEIRVFFSKTKSLYLRDALMDFDIPKAGHVFDTSSSKLPVDFLGSEQIPGSNFHDLDFSIAEKSIFGKLIFWFIDISESAIQILFKFLLLLSNRLVDVWYES